MDLQLIKENTQQIQSSLSKKEKDQFESDKIVLSDGKCPNKIMVVARDLGSDELREGVPLIGTAGSLYRFVEMQLGFEAFKCNTVPYKPIGNKAFSKDIREKFRPTVMDLIEVVDPKVIILMGNEAMEIFTGVGSGITGFAQEGPFVWLHPTKKKSRSWVELYPIVHPSYLIRNGVTIKSLKNNINCKRLFKELFFKNIYRAYQSSIK